MQIEVIDVLLGQKTPETLEQLKARILDGLGRASSVDVTEEALEAIVTDLPRDKPARAEAIGGALLSPIEPIGGGCRFHRMNAPAAARQIMPDDGFPAFVPPNQASKAVGDSSPR